MTPSEARKPSEREVERAAKALHDLDVEREPLQPHEYRAMALAALLAALQPEGPPDG